MLSRRFLIAVIFLNIPIALGLYARYKAIPVWEKNKELFYVENRPIFTAYDSYYFARLAEDYKRGIFVPGGKDKLRFVPDYGTYPKVIPFYSWLFAELSSIFNTYIENLAFWLIPIFALLFAIPLFLLFESEGLLLTGLGGALVGSLSLIYAVRTGINRLDTDSLVLFSLFALPFAVYKTYNSKSVREKYVYLLLVALFSNLFYWGYLHPGLNLVLFIFSLLYLSFPLIKERNFRGLSERNFLKEVALLTLTFNPWILLEGLTGLINHLYNYLFHFEKPIEGNFPNVQMSISELQRLSLDQIATLTVGSKILFILGGLGLLALVVFRFRTFLLIAPTFLIGLLALKGASRFAMFLAPFVGLGLGFILDLLYLYLFSKLKKEYIAFPTLLVLGIFLTVIVSFANKTTFKLIPRPIMTSSVAEAFIELGRQTPKNAWILTWWDYGYAIQYYARRATFHDGGSQFSPKTYFVALALTSNSPQVGYNVTKSLTVCGAKCINKLFKKGLKPKEIKEKFVKNEFGKSIKHPVYWAFTRDLIGKFYWISYFGSWDFETLKGKHYQILNINCVPKGLNYICAVGKELFYFDTLNLLLVRNRSSAIPVRYFAVRDRKGLKLYKNDRYPYGFAVEKVYTYKDGYYRWFLTDLDTFGSNFNRMYILRVFNKKYFKLVKERFPDYVFYLVR